MPILDRFTSGVSIARRVQAVAARDVLRPADGLEKGSRADSVALDVSARVCGASGCTSGWLKPWKNRSRPVFESDWGCSGRCLHTMVSAAVRREMGEALNDVIEPHRHRVPLGLVLLAQGWITHPQLQTALASQRAAGQGRIGDWLTRTTGLPEERIARGLGVQWNCPVLSLDGFSPRAMALAMPKRFVAEFGLVPVRVAGQSILYVAFQETMQAAAALALEQMCGLKVESGLLPATELEQARRRLLEADSVPVRIRLMKDADALTDEIVKLLEQKQPVASRLVRIHQYYWMRMWREEGAIPSYGTIPNGIEDMEDHIFMVA
jgi:hypothetical protein